MIAKLIIYGIIAAAALTLLGLIYAAIGNHFTAPLKLELKASQQATETAVKANTDLQASLDNLKAQLAAQNKAVSDVQARSDAMVAASAAALAQARSRASATASTIASLKLTAASKGTDNGCPAVDKLLTDLANDRVRYGPSTGQPSPGVSSQGSGNGSLRIH